MRYKTNIKNDSKSKKTKVFTRGFLGVLMIFIYGSGGSIAQTTFAPEGSFWRYDYGAHDGSFSKKYVLKVVEDSVINSSDVIKKIKRYGIYTFSYPPHPPVGTIDSTILGDLRVRNDSIFFNEDFVYSFIMNQGDTVFINSMLYAVVDTMYYSLINSNNLKTWELTKYCQSGQQIGRATIIEGIGPINDYLFWNTDGCLIGGGYYSFECYQSPSLAYNEPCNMFLKDTKNALFVQKNIDVSPNPCTGYFIIKSTSKLESAEVIVFDTNMKEQYKNSYFEQKEMLINTTGIKNGVYFVYIITKEDCVIKKVIISD
jgi:hypothetical protein